jgi:Holliday junction resolvase RusA-like endonuclease
MSLAKTQTSPASNPDGALVRSGDAEGPRVAPGRRIVLVIPGAPRTKKTSNRIVRVGGSRKSFKILPSAAHESWFERAMLLMRAEFRALTIAGLAPIARPVHVRAIFYRDAARGDLVGYQQALADFLERAGIIVNDKYVVSWDGTRLEVDRGRPRIEVTVTVLHAPRGGRSARRRSPGPASWAGSGR